MPNSGDTVLSETQLSNGLAPQPIVVNVAFGPDVKISTVLVERGTLTAYVPSQVSGTVIAGTVVGALAPEGTLAWLLAARLLPAYGAVQAEAQSLQRGLVA
jgi:hypothetical protein